jgi:hypothetical protein
VSRAEPDISSLRTHRKSCISKLGPLCPDLHEEIICVLCLQPGSSCCHSSCRSRYRSRSCCRSRCRSCHWPFLPSAILVVTRSYYDVPACAPDQFRLDGLQEAVQIIFVPVISYVVLYIVNACFSKSEIVHSYL